MGSVITKFRTGASLSAEQQRVVAHDLAIAGVVSRRPGASGERLPEASARLAAFTGGEDRSAIASEEDLDLLLAPPSAIRDAEARLESLASRLGHRYAIVGEASTAPTDERKTWIIQILVPIPFLWISFGIPVEYAATPDAPHSTVSARIVDLASGEVLAASFELGPGIDANESPRFRKSEARRAVRRMLVERPR
jgi:hypothetical protein